MRNLLLFILLFSGLTVFSQRRTDLNKGWTFNQQDKTAKMPAIVPGSVQADLLRLKKMPDPFLLLNEEKTEWVERTGWQFHKSFIADAALLKSDRLFLVFEGLDTYAKVYLNEMQVLSADNMHRTWRTDIKKFVRSGENKIRIDFSAIPDIAGPMAKASKIKYPADNEKGALKMSPFVRKAQFQFGWDFAPRLLTTGIWKPVYLEHWTEAAIVESEVTVKQFNPKRADCRAHLTVEATRPGSYLMHILDRSTGKLLWTTTRQIKAGTNKIEQAFTLPHPKIWWPSGMGRPNLHRLELKLTSPGGKVLSKVLNVGIRTIEVVNEPDSIGQSFYVKVNGRPVFIKGANFVPVSSLNEADNKGRLEKLFQSMVESNFNMIRVWGGGYYESDHFYELADRYGIMVWQDFPFACTMYPSDDQFMANIAAEAADNIKRIRQHPSLALWCGNNEVAVGWQNWGWQKTYGYSQADSLELINGYNKLFKKLLPELVAQHDGGRFYFHSSPISNWGKPEDFRIGDNHYWGVYHGEAPFSAYETHIPRFNSEFGFQSFPSWQTLQQITGTNMPALSGDVLTKRQKSYKGNALLSKYMDWYYQKPTTDEEFVYLSQLQQAEGMRIAIEASRRAAPHNMGTLMWQLNDVWPAISWSAIEYNGQWKAAQYLIRKAYAPTAISVKENNGQLAVTIVTDQQLSGTAMLVVTKWNVDGSQVRLDPIPAALPDASRPVVVNVPLTKLGLTNRSTEFIVVQLLVDGKQMADNLLYFVPVKDLRLPEARITSAVVEQGGKLYLQVKSDKLVKNAGFSLNTNSAYHFEDNFIDLLPGRQYHIAIRTKLPAETVRKLLKIDFVKNRMK